MKKKDAIVGLLTAGVAPFLVVLFQLAKKNPDEPVTKRDLVVIFGFQMAVFIALAIKVFFFNYAVLG